MNLHCIYIYLHLLTTKYSTGMFNYFKMLITFIGKTFHYVISLQ